MHAQLEQAQRKSLEPGPSNTAGPPQKAATLKIRVLLIEDEPADAELIQIRLSRHGEGRFELEHVTRLSAGLERLDKGGIGIVLCDLSLPDSGGLATLRAIQARAPGIPVIVLSGYDDTRLAVQAVHEGAQDYLMKGHADGQLLVRAMYYALERKGLTDQLTRYAEELRKKNAQLEADFNMAREIQEIFLPQQYPSFPSWVGPEQSALKFTHRYLPADAVGGDFFDVFPLSNTAAGVFICDVMGHGMRAALVTAIMRGLVEELIHAAEDPGRFLSGLNRSLNAILRRTRDPFLATAFYGVIDVAAREIRFANAGHPSPLMVKAGSGSVEALKTCDPGHGPALGLFARPAFPVARCPIEAGDQVLLFTDGLFEADNREGKEFGQARLLETVRELAGTPPPALLDTLLARVSDFTGGEPFHDDVCLLAAHVAHTDAA